MFVSIPWLFFHQDFENGTVMKITTSFEESINRLHGAMTHKTFADAIAERWKSRPGHDNEVLASAWCWLFCWGMTGNGSPRHKELAQEVFNEIFSPINFRSFTVDGEFHTEARRLRYQGGDDDDYLRGLLGEN
jgi:hypothetical protein